MIIEGSIITVIATVFSSLLTGCITYKVAVINADKDRAVKREDFMDSQMRLLMKTYQSEVDGLKVDITILQDENQKLKNEVLNLRSKITEIEGGYNNEGKITISGRS